VKKNLMSMLPDALMVAGAAAVSYGAWAIYPPAGYIVGGVIMAGAGWLVAKGTA
jgi:hypothetical protein